MDGDPKQRLEYLYKEYARLSDKAEDFIKNTYEDFKLLGVVGAIIIIWKPISEVVQPLSPKIDANLFLFFGFLTLLIVLGMITLFSLIKQSYAWYFVHNLQAYEIEIKKELGEAADSEVFNFNLGKEQARFVIACYRLSYQTFILTSFVVVILLPFIILCYSSIFYAFLHLAVGIFGCTLYIQIFRRTIRQFSNNRLL